MVVVMGSEEECRRRWQPFRQIDGPAGQVGQAAVVGRRQDGLLDTGDGAAPLRMLLAMAVDDQLPQIRHGF